MTNGAASSAMPQMADDAPPVRPPAAGLSRSTSQTIRIARVLCILALVYVHAPPHDDAVPRQLLSEAGLLWSWREIVGRTSVALLSVISGFLIVRLEAGGGWTANLRRKVTTLIVPLLWWNALTLVKDFAESGGQLYPDLAELPRLLLALDGYPATVPTYFLRDLFVCNVLLTPLLFLARRAPLVTFLLLFGNAFLNLDGVLLLNDVIPLFYFCGLMIGVGALPAVMKVAVGGARGMMLGLAALGVLVGETLGRLWAGPAVPGEVHQLGLIAGRFAGATLFWLLATRLRTTWMSDRIQPFEPIIFFVFCSHPLSLGLAWWCLGALHVEFGSLAYIAFFILSPLIALLSGVAGVAVMRIVTPWLLARLMGGRIPTAVQMAKIAAVLMPWRQLPEGDATRESKGPA